MMEEKKKKLKITDPVHALEKARAWCAYQERSQQEMRDKLYEWGLWKDAVENIIAELVVGNFINEERFAKAYAGGKFRIKKWGKVKIRIELKRKGITEYCIRKGLHEISDDEYEKALQKIIEDRALKTGDRNPLKRNYKIAQYAISRGYEPQLVWKTLKMEAPGE